MTGDLLWLSLGLLFLMIGGESVVRGATGLARSLGVSPLVIGLTVVAFGTSAPELAVNVIAAWENRVGISFGNILGSNMANIGLIVGCTAIMRPLLITGIVIAREIPMMLLATACAVVMAFDALLTPGAPDVIGRGDGLILLLLFMVFLYYTIGDFVQQRTGNGGTSDLTADYGPTDTSVGRYIVISAIGMVALIGGADLTVEAGASAARALGVPEVIIGLTVLAIGTSLPELVASVAATMRGHAELAIGNIVGSNIFNLLLVAGVTSVIRPIPIPRGGHLDILVVAILSLMLFFVSMTANRRIIRGEAALLLAGYLGYMAWRTGM
jgi:cation:H+ antiporter